MGCISTDNRGSSPPQAARYFCFSAGFTVADFGCRDSGGFSFASVLCLSSDQRWCDKRPALDAE
jgi:hypothetical protein